MRENYTNVIVFPSTHQISEQEILSYLAQKALEARRQGTQIVVKKCPFCHPIKNKTDMYALKITPESGAYFCHRCNARGSFTDLRKYFGDPPIVGQAWHPRIASVQEKPLPNPLMCEMAPKNLKFVPQSKEILLQRKISEETLSAYGVGTMPYNFYDPEMGEWVTEDCWTFPQYRKSSTGPQIARLKLRSMKNKGNMRSEPVGAAAGLFGLNLVPDQSDSVILTEGEWDAMAIYEATKIPACSIPNGANSCPDEIIEMLASYTTILLWFDDDVPGHDGCIRFAQKLGVERCRIVPNFSTKDANEALSKGQDLFNNLEASKPIPHKNIIHISDLKDELYREFKNPSESSGVKAKSLPMFSTAIGGLRMGEVTILSGMTGRGKSTWLSQVSLDYAKQGVGTLWGSFEIKNVKMAKTMIRQFAKKNFENMDGFDKHVEEFNQLPVYFTSFFGFTPLDDLMEAIRYAVRCFGITHVCLDNLQFMCNSGQGGGWQDEFQIQGRVITTIRAMATQLNIHITIVIHPRKQESDHMPIGISDIFGRGQATQEADNIIILQSLNEDQVRYIDIKKNRDGGTLTKIHYKFDEETRLIQELTAEEKKVIQPLPVKKFSKSTNSAENVKSIAELREKKD